MNDANRINRIAIILFIALLQSAVAISQTVFMPDYSLNSMLTLKDTSRLYALIPKGSMAQQYVYEGNDRVFVTFTNNTGTEYAKAFLHEGTHFTFYEFEIGMMNESMYEVPAIMLSLEHFMTESGIRLGLTKDEITDIKGNDYMFFSDNKACFYYKANPLEELDYLYTVTFSEGLVTQIAFGFHPL